MYVLACAGLFRISKLLFIRCSNDITEDRYKIFVEVSKVDEYKEGSWLYIARNVHRHKKHSKENVLFSKPFSPGEREKFSRKKKRSYWS